MTSEDWAHDSINAISALKTSQGWAHDAIKRVFHAHNIASRIPPPQLYVDRL